MELPSQYGCSLHQILHFCREPVYPGDHHRGDALGDVLLPFRKGVRRQVTAVLFNIEGVSLCSPQDEIHQFSRGALRKKAVDHLEFRLHGEGFEQDVLIDHAKAGEQIPDCAVVVGPAGSDDHERKTLGVPYQELR